jgi:hypothetical protein
MHKSSSLALESPSLLASISPRRIETSRKIHPSGRSGNSTPNPQSLNRRRLRNAFDSVPDLADSEVKFDNQGDGLARYDILNYQKLPNTSGYHYKVGLFLCIYATGRRVQPSMSQLIEGRVATRLVMYVCFIQLMRCRSWASGFTRSSSTSTSSCGTRARTPFPPPPARCPAPSE